jgi:immunity protein 5 of polymorphic toxin system
MRLDERDHRSLVLWATDCAEHVLPYFEEKHPKDRRPRSAVEAGRAWARGEITTSEARAAAFAAHAAARDADQGSARAAARAAGHAVATAHVAGHAHHAANYAVTAARFPDASDPAGSAAARERDWQDRRLPKHLRPVAFPARGETRPDPDA